MKCLNIVLLFYVYLFGISNVSGNESWQSIKEPISQIAGILTGNKFGGTLDPCEGVLDSPVNLPADATIASFGKLKFTGFRYFYDAALSLEDGVVVLTLKHQRQILISGGGLKGTYYLNKIKYMIPSQHKVAGASYLAEILMEFIHEKYTTLEFAYKAKYGIAILGIFVMVGSNPNSALQMIVDAIPDLMDNLPTIDLESKFSPQSILPEDTCSFFRYQGKLSNTECAGIATWTLFTQPIEIGITLADSMATSFEMLKSTGTKGLDQIKEQIVNEFDNLKSKKRGIITIQPRMFCKNTLFNNDMMTFPWFFFHRSFK